MVRGRGEETLNRGTVGLFRVRVFHVSRSSRLFRASPGRSPNTNAQGTGVFMGRRGLLCEVERFNRSSGVNILGFTGPFIPNKRFVSKRGTRRR